MEELELEAFVERVVGDLYALISEVDNEQRGIPQFVTLERYKARLAGQAAGIESAIAVLRRRLHERS